MRREARRGGRRSPRRPGVRLLSRLDGHRCPAQKGIGREADASADPPAEGPIGGVPFSLHRARTDRVARPGKPPDGPPRPDRCGARCTVGQAARDEAREGRVVVRPLLENSTACRKSVPSSTPSSGLCVWGGISLVDGTRVSARGLSRDQIIYGEFDPGSGRTLAACLTHASRTRAFLRGCS